MGPFSFQSPPATRWRFAFLHLFASSAPPGLSPLNETPPSSGVSAWILGLFALLFWSGWQQVRAGTVERFSGLGWD